MRTAKSKTVARVQGCRSAEPIQAKKRIADILAMKLEGKVERCGRDVSSKSFDIDSLGYFGPDGALSALLHLAPRATGLSSVPHQ